MILSNTEIHRALDEKRLVIDPEPKPRFPTIGGSDCPYDTHSVDLCLSKEITIPKKGTYTYDLTQPGNIADLIGGFSEKIILTDRQPLPLKPGEFILARTLEYIGLPIQPEQGPHLAARIEGKSSRARCGLLVHFTAPTVHPGFMGSLTLEIINLGPASIMLRPGMPIAQLIVEEVIGKIIANPSQFYKQSTPEGV